MLFCFGGMNVQNNICHQRHLSITYDIRSLRDSTLFTADMIFLCTKSHDFCYIYIFTPVTMKNAVFWNKETHFVPYRKHITSPLQSPSGLRYVRFGDFTPATMTNAVFRNIKTQFLPDRRHIMSPL
jgi:hypothetical protein